MIKIGLIKNFDPSLFEDYLVCDFNLVNRGGTDYHQLTAFSEYIDDRFDLSFNSIEDYNKWLTDFIYIIIPSELIPSLVELSSFVEDIDVANQFNVVLSKTSITTRNAATYNIPCDVINMTPCKLLAWEKGDDDILQGIIEVWNSYEDYRVIDFACKFDSLPELEAFKAMQT
jgi:hypothetical protein